MMGKLEIHTIRTGRDVSPYSGIAGNGYRTPRNLSFVPSLYLPHPTPKAHCHQDTNLDPTPHTEYLGTAAAQPRPSFRPWWMEWMLPPWTSRGSYGYDRVRVERACWRVETAKMGVTGVRVMG